MKPFILVTAPVETRSGYGNHARDICQALIESDKYDIVIQSVPWGTTPTNALQKDNKVHNEISKRILRQPNLPKQPDLHYHIVIPNEFQVIGKKNVGITAGIETTIPPANWVEGCNRMDMTIFTSEFSRNGFKNVTFDRLDSNTKQIVGQLKLEKPTEVLFEGADTDIYKEVNNFSDDIEKQFDKIKEDFCFLFVGHWLQGNLGEDRKDIGMMIKTFLTTFKNTKNPPALILKTSGANFSIIDRREIIRKIKMVKDTVKSETLPNIYLIHGELSDREMNEMYNWIRPEISVPVHGEHRHLKEHYLFAKSKKIKQPMLIENGDVLKLYPGPSKIINKVNSGKLLVDGNRLIDEESSVLRDRKNISFNGMMDISLIISKNGDVERSPIISLRGLPLYDQELNEVKYELEDKIFDICKSYTLNNRKQEGNLIDNLKNSLRKLIQIKVSKRPYTNINLIRL